MNIYRSSDYRKIISKWVEIKKSKDPKYSLLRLAESLGVKSSFLSKVLNGRLNFSQDHMYLFCKIFEFNQEQTSYMYLLLDAERAGILDRKKELLSKVRSIQSMHRTTRKNLNSDFLIEERQQNLFQEYYLNPYFPVVHIFLTVPQYQRNTELMGKKLGLRAVQMKEILKALERMKIIRWIAAEKRYEALIQNIQLPEDAVLNTSSHALFKSLALSQYLRVPRAEKYAFSMTLSLDESSVDRIKEDFMIFLKKVEATIASTTPQRVYEMSFDLFPWDY